jgi:GNAT superfamily N-acetyltransferase
MSTELRARLAAPSDRDLVVEVITLAFADDPLWSRALARPGGGTDLERRYWGILVDGALRHRSTWLADDGAAVAVWIPPGGTELTDQQEHEIVELVTGELGSGADDCLTLLGRFDAAHPHDRPHHYLSLLGTHPDHRGRGIGMALLGHNLALVDLESSPAYLESSNPANDVRYGSVGFEPIGAFSFPGDGPVVTTMWRPAR